MAEGHERIATAFRGPEFREKLKLAEDEARVLTELEAFFGANQEVKPYTEDEARETERKLELLKEAYGLDGVLGVVTSPFTQTYVRKAMPPNIRKRFFTEMYYQVGDRPVQILPEFAQNTIHVGEDGSISGEDRQRMEDLLRNRVGLLVGGGPGYPTDVSRTPLLLAIEQALRDKTAAAGLCLGHQDLAHLAGFDLVPGSVSAGAQVETPTAAGRQHPVVGRLGERIGAVAFHSAEVQYKQGAGVTILSTGASTGGAPVSLLYGSAFEAPDQVMSTQHHPEVDTGVVPGQNVELTPTEEILDVEGKRLVIPAGIPVGQAAIVRYGASNWEKFRAIGMRPEDLQDVIRPERLFPLLGRNFIGPTIDWLATTRLKNLRGEK